MRDRGLAATHLVCVWPRVPTWERNKNALQRFLMMCQSFGCGISSGMILHPCVPLIVTRMLFWRISRKASDGSGANSWRTHMIGCPVARNAWTSESIAATSRARSASAQRSRKSTSISMTRSIGFKRWLPLCWSKDTRGRLLAHLDYERNQRADVRNWPDYAH
jgi:hypothetical protein